MGIATRRGSTIHQLLSSDASTLSDAELGQVSGGLSIIQPQPPIICGLTLGYLIGSWLSGGSTAGAFGGY